MEVPLDFDQKQCIDSLQEAKKNFLVASNAYDKISNLHGTHIIEKNINKTPTLNFALFEVKD